MALSEEKDSASPLKLLQNSFCNMDGKKLLSKDYALAEDSERSEVHDWFSSVKESTSFEHWMSELPSLLKSLPITSLAIPGTHDSMSYGISKSSEISPDSTSLVKALGRFLGMVVKPVLFRWCVTQHQTTAEQLSAGIRYFDLRIAVHKPSGNFQFVHGMYAEEIVSSLTEIKEFLLNHKGEVVVLDMQHFYEFNPAYHQQLQRFMQNLYGFMICPAPEGSFLSSVTLNWLAKCGYQVIIVYRSPAAHCNPYLWPGTLWPTPWPETKSVSSLIEFLKNGLQNRPDNAGFVSQCVLTPDTWFVLHHIFSNLRIQCANPCNYGVISWLEQQHPDLMMIRRSPTRIELKLDDLQDYESMRKEMESKKASTSNTTWAPAKTKQDVVRERIGYVPQPHES